MLLKHQIYIQIQPYLVSKSGAEKLSLNQVKSNVNCNEGYCIINWTLQSTWHLDDVDDVVWMVTARDSDGLQTGPATMIRETQFNEIENDLEVFELSVFDLSNNQINDWTNPNWPYRLSEQNTLSVAGSVRFEGITNALIDEGDAEIEIRLSAIPPINYSGGTNEWPNEEVDWSMSWFTEVGLKDYSQKKLKLQMLVLFHPILQSNYPYIFRGLARICHQMNSQ